MSNTLCLGSEANVALNGRCRQSPHEHSHFSSLLLWVFIKKMLLHPISYLAQSWASVCSDKKLLTTTHSSFRCIMFVFIRLMNVVYKGKTNTAMSVDSMDGYHTHQLNRWICFHIVMHAEHLIHWIWSEMKWHHLDLFFYSNDGK